MFGIAHGSSTEHVLDQRLDFDAIRADILKRLYITIGMTCLMRSQQSVPAYLREGCNGCDKVAPACNGKPSSYELMKTENAKERRPSDVRLRELLKRSREPTSIKKPIIGIPLLDRAVS
jgi:hypothetical protein